MADVTGEQELDPVALEVLGDRFDHPAAVTSMKGTVSPSITMAFVPAVA